jgi:hypothetical protein
MVQLSKNDRMLLRSLKRIKRGSVEALAKDTALRTEAVLQSAYLLQTKGLLHVEEDTHTSYELTEEGLTYAEKGLPERQVHDYLLINGPTPLSDLQGIFPAVQIAIGWLKRRGWAVIETVNGNSFLSPRPADELPEERVLQDVKVMKRFTLSDVSVKQQQAERALKELATRNLKHCMRQTVTLQILLLNLSFLARGGGD